MSLEWFLQKVMQLCIEISSLSLSLCLSSSLAFAWPVNDLQQVTGEDLHIMSNQVRAASAEHVNGLKWSRRHLWRGQEEQQADSRAVDREGWLREKAPPDPGAGVRKGTRNWELPPRDVLCRMIGISSDASLWLTHLQQAGQGWGLFEF